MPDIHDRLEPILADLDACEDHARELIAVHAGHRVYPKDAPALAMARIVVALRPLLDQANELGAELEVLEARVAGLEAQLAEVQHQRDVLAAPTAEEF